MKKILFFVEARMGSHRLPGKVLRKINDNNLVIDYVLQNILNSSFIKKNLICLMTSKNAENTRLVNYVRKKYNIEIFRGSEKNVYNRVYKFVKKKRVDYLLRFTGDNPLVDPMLIDKFISYFLNYKCDYLSSRAMDKSKVWKARSDFPEGLSLEIFSKKIFLSFKKKINLNNMEFPTSIFTNQLNKKIKIKKFPIVSSYKNISKKMRVTVDVKKDLIFVKKLAKRFNFEPGKNNILNFLNKSSIKERKQVYINIYKSN